VTGGHNVDHVYKINENEVAVLGRSAEADVRVQDENASRRHCCIEYVEARWMLTDLDSMNGTLVNREQVTSSRLNSGDEIRVAGMIFEFTVDEPISVPDTEAVEPPSAKDGCVCAQCGRDLPEDPVDTGQATEIGGRLFCKSCVVPHAGPESDSGDASQGRARSETGEQFASLLESLERATDSDRPAEPAPSAEPSASSSAPGLLDRLRREKPVDET